MSRLYSDEDPDLHYRGTSAHCWVAPLGTDQTEWEGAVREHLVDHLNERWSLDRPLHSAVHRELP